MTSFVLARLGILGRIAASVALPVALASCSSSVSGPTPVDDPNRVTLQPETAVLYSGLPTTFTVSGGTGTYSLTSSNQAVVQVPAFLNGRTFTVIPANVVADTQVTITARDSGTAPLASSALTVRPGTVANNITVTPTSTQGGSCAPAVCSGGDAIVSATLSQGGNPLPARGVRLDAVAGDFRFVVSSPGQGEVLSTSTTVITDQAGGIHVPIRVLPGSPNQTAVVQVTDLGTQAFQRTTFSIAQATGSSPGFFTVPSEVTFSGINNLACAVGVRADVVVFGGSPPYTIGNGGTAFSVSNNIVTSSGGSFYIVANGTCAENVPIAVVDSAGRTTTVTVSNVPGTQAVPDLVASPASVTLSDCNATANVTLAGGIPNSLSVTRSSGAISADFASGLLTIRRTPNTVATTPLSVGVSSGDKSATVTVNLTGEALTSRCEPSTLRVTPSTVSFAGCGFVEAIVTGGTGAYTHALSNNSSITAALVGPGDVVRITRVPGSEPLSTPGTVTVRDSSGATREITVTVSGTC